ncbi:MAG: hypothetical protein KAY00_01220 [Agitococcus sp.]|nr:hypothetical protein [Agitococcus sp.]
MKTDILPSSNIHELVSAIINDPTSKTARQNLYQQVKNGRFFLAVHGIPLNLYNALDSNQVFVNQQLINMPLQLAVADNGSKALLAYLDKETLDANAPNHWAIEVSGSDLLNLVILNHEFSATVLKGSMGWAGIAKEDARLLMKGYAV